MSFTEWYETEAKGVYEFHLWNMPPVTRATVIVLLEKAYEAGLEEAEKTDQKYND